jgi:adhesin HecA-like repeat protein
LARAVQVNTGIWAKDLRVVTGANEVNANTNAATPIAGSGAVPAFALDVAALGGMYAGKITLIGTEAGVGVNNAGTLAANGGDLVLSVNGMLTNTGTIDAQGTTSVKATTINNTGSGKIYGDSVAIAATTLNNTNAAVIAARDRLDVGAATINNSEHALILSAGDMAIGGTLDANNQASGSASTLRNGSATIESLGNLRIAADSIVNANDHFAYGEQLISTQSNIYESPWANYYRIFNRYEYEPVVTQDDPGQIIAAGNMALAGTTITNQQSKIIAGGTLTASGTTINNTTVSADKRTNDVGIQYSWGVTGGHSEFNWGWHWVLDYGYVPSGYNVNTLTNTTVSQGVALPNASAGAVSTTPARSTVTAPASTTASTLSSALFNTPTNPSATER